MKSFYEWINYIQKFNLDTQKSNFKNVTYVAKKLGISKLNTFIYIVGGTNGKGTTCYVLETILLKHGYKVGLYTSPHLLRYTERIRINGCELNKSLYVASFIDIERVRGALPLTCYDFMTLSALYLFKNSQLDVVILEVGLGGRFDATNIVTPNISVITNVDLDHIDILGSNRHLISMEKIGILRNNKIAIISEKKLPKIAKKIIKKNKVKVRLVNRDWFYKKYDTTWSFINNDYYCLNLPLPQVPLINVATALAAVSESKISLKNFIIKNCLKNFFIPGRFQIVSCYPKIILDVAHNGHAANYLLKKLVNMKRIGKIYVIIGVLREKNIFKIITPLISIIDFWYCVKLKTHRSINPEEMAQYLPNNSYEVCVSLEDAWNKVQGFVNVNDIILIYGSFFAVREMYKILKI
ncbi:MAG: bifunctional tetrahydrofolate synthase/dihydrofolate synthase [Buchnera aphidicola (Nurudea shiraii)]